MRRFWTEAEVEFAVKHVGTRMWTVAKVAERLERTPRAVIDKLIDLGVRRPILRELDGMFTAASLGRAMGVSQNITVGWIQRGLLPAHRSAQRGKTAAWAIYPADLIEFLERHPSAYEYHRIPVWHEGRPNRVRAWAKRGCPLAGYVTLSQACRMLGIHGWTLLRWRRRGILTATSIEAGNVNRQERFILRADVERLLRERGECRKAA